MRKRITQLPAFLLCALLALQGCNIAKRLPPGEKLYVGTDVEIRADSTTDKAAAKSLRDELKALARPRPNKTIFGFPYKVALYYFFGNPKSENGLRGTLRRKLGEAPVLASAKALGSSANIMTAFLENEGYFRSRVSGSLKESSYKARGQYVAKVAPRYYIDSVAFLVDSTPARSMMYSIAPRTLLKAGAPYRFETIKAERARISQTLQQRGFFYFLPDYIAILADSAVKTQRVKLYLAIKPDMPEAAGVPYNMRNVYIYPNYTLTNAARDTSVARTYRPPVEMPGTALPMRGFFINDSTRIYDPRLFNDIISLRPGQRYSSRQQDITLSRFINLNTFKFVRNRFEPVENSSADTAQLDVHYYLTPLPKKSARVEIAGTSRSNNLTGTQLTISWRNRNALRRAELLTVSLLGGIEYQVGAGAQGLTNYRYGAETSLTFPRLVSPFPIRYDNRQTLPKTIATLAYDRLTRGGLYSLNSFRGSFGYAFRVNQQSELVVQPFNVNYVFVPISSIGERFVNIVADNPAYARLIDDQLILSSLFTYTFNSSPRRSTNNTYQLIANFEPAGNLAGLLVPKNEEDGQRRLFKVPFSQYLRLDLDNRFYRKLTPRVTWANRLFTGVGLPYGNTNGSALEPQLPFVKQYFVGGSNSLRGFRPRGIGPGTYTRPSDVVLFQDGGGDIKLEANTEIRAKLTQLIQLAAFVDAGNVWMTRDESTYGPGSVFSKDFMKQVAVSTGLGLRLDLSYFLIRFDLAFPLRKPNLPDGERWVGNQINFGSRDWRRENLILNVAVGYPF